MADTEKKQVTIPAATETLLNFAIDRSDMLTILEGLPANADIDRGKIEYESSKTRAAP